MATTNNLYPPIIDTIMPAFLINSANIQKNKCRIYFSLSMFNSLSEIENVQISVRDQNTNLCALNLDKYPSEIKLDTIKIDSKKTTNDKYYIELLPSDIVNNNFIIDRYYKVQLRFTSAQIPAEEKPSLEIPQAIDAWLNKNLEYFSEWSTVCLIRGISAPSLTLMNFSEGITEFYSSIANIQLLGKLTFADSEENEILSSYRIIITDENEDLVLDSGNLYTNTYVNVNEFSYDLNYSFNINETYLLKVIYTTNNSYQDEIEYYFIVIQADVEKTIFNTSLITDEENGKIDIQIHKSFESPETFTGSVIIRRTSNETNFTKWEDLYIQPFKEVSLIDISWSDYTIESGIYYQYAVQAINSSGAREPITKIEDPVMLNFENIFLTSQGKQINIKFNPSISSFKQVISEVKIETIGSQYPFIKRNGNINYAQFPISGLIASSMDENNMFTSKENEFNNSYEDYKKYNKKCRIDNLNDVIYEKAFRKRVLDFLYRDSVKLFRSPTEGNLLIKLMDIQCQPNQTLGRRLWSFSATANEIDACSLENLKKYNIITIDAELINGSGSGEEPGSLIPIKRVVFYDRKQDLPEVGTKGILYVCGDQLYVWDEDNNKYILLLEAKVIWNDTNSSITGLMHAGRNLFYTDNKNLYKWDKDSDELKIVSGLEYGELD